MKMTLTSRGLLRFFIFIVLYILFLAIGAVVFSAIEGPEEVQSVQSLRAFRTNFLNNHHCVTVKSVLKSIHEEMELSRQAAKVRYSNDAEPTLNLTHDISLSEAKRIINVENIEKEEIDKKYEYLYNANSPKKGGSFYLQSKVFRAREKLYQELNCLSNKKVHVLK
ncbi:unnamed protein product [Brassicogethes aeneus]|uniref:Uncharacterized protein n=1 Tax=Brassicogethes aeneus TaxID=1431903 RepID=A0A9P0B1L4_BRAAE|nr:unnamed protein product [Brassicogethes aeneus]